jgi:hypothetical protein
MPSFEPRFLEEELMLLVSERMLAGDHLVRDVRLVSGPFPYTLWWLSSLDSGVVLSD